MKKTWKALIAAVALGAAISQAHAAGAIVVNDEEGAAEYQFAMVTYASSNETAGRDALDECRLQGNKSCVVMARFNQCGAVAVSDKFFRTGTGATPAIASRNALEHCPGCRLAQVACDEQTEAPRFAVRSAGVR